MTTDELQDCLAYCRTAFATVDRAFKMSEKPDALTEIWLSVWRDLKADHVLDAIRRVVADLELQPRSASQFPARIAQLAKQVARDAMDDEVRREYATDQTEGCPRCKGKRWLFVRPFDANSRRMADEENWPASGLYRIGCECNEQTARRYDPDKHGPALRRSELWKLSLTDSLRDPDIIAPQLDNLRRLTAPRKAQPPGSKGTARQLSAGEIAQVKADLKREAKARWKSGTKLAGPK